jgi:hypothetical protein
MILWWAVMTNDDYRFPQQPFAHAAAVNLAKCGCCLLSTLSTTNQNLDSSS